MLMVKFFKKLAYNFHTIYIFFFILEDCIKNILLLFSHFNAINHHHPVICIGFTIKQLIPTYNVTTAITKQPLSYLTHLYNLTF